MDEGTELERSEELIIIGILWASCVKMFFYGFMKLASPYEKPPFPFLFVPSMFLRSITTGETPDECGSSSSGSLTGERRHTTHTN